MGITDGAVTYDAHPYLAVFRALANAVYIGAFRNAVNVGGAHDYYDLPIGENFIARWDGLKSGGNLEEAAAALRVTADLMRIFDVKLEINASPGNERMQVIVDDVPFGLHELGGGLAQWLVVLAFVAMRQPRLILIDEPELNLHPSLQVDFLMTPGPSSTRAISASS
jgi:hypothetical protein